MNTTLNNTLNDTLNKPFTALDPTPLEALIDISYLQTEPDKVNWKIDIGDEWNYQTIKEEAMKKYTVVNEPTNYRDKNKIKVLLSNYIYDGFETMKNMIAQSYGIILESPEYQQMVEGQNPLTANFPKKFKAMTKSVVNKINEIQRDWYEDWKNYGDIENIEPIQEKLRGMNATNRAKEVKKYKKYYEDLYNAGGGDENNNPLKWWVKHKAITSIDNAKMISAEQKELYLNTQRYNKDTVEKTLENYLLEVGKLPNNNLKAAYMLIEEIMDYVGRFGTIIYRLHTEKPWSFRERVASLNIPKNFHLNVDNIKDLLLAIYDAFGEKFNNMTNFAKFAPRYSLHFKNYRTVNAILFELYAIRQNGDYNRNNFDINTMLNRFKAKDSSFNARQVEGVKKYDWGRLFSKLGRKWRGEDISDDESSDVMPYFDLGNNVINPEEMRKFYQVPKAISPRDIPITETDIDSTMLNIPDDEEEESTMLLDNSEVFNDDEVEWA